MPSLQDVRQALQCGGSNCACRRPSGNVHCPVSSAHKRGDKDPSLSVEVKNGTLVWKCYSGCPQNAVRDALVGLGLWGQSQKPAPIPIRRGQEPVAVYRYVTADGELVGEKGRFETPTGKTFKWRLSGKAWSGLEGTPMSSMPLYNLPQVLSEPDATVWFVEGEKAVEACRKAGLVAVCLGGGAGQQQPGNALDPLVGRDVVLWPDNDEPGQAFMERIGRLLPHARIVRPVVEDKGDAYDYFEAGGTVAALRELCREGQPSVRITGDNSLDVLYPTPAGEVTFSFNEIVVGARATDAMLTVAWERSQDDYRVRLNLVSHSGQEGIARSLAKVFKGGPDEWPRMLAKACSMADGAIRRVDLSIDLFDVESAPVREWAVDRFAPKGVVTIPFGMGESGKSLLCADIALHMLYGEPWADRKTMHTLGVLIVDYEDQPDEWEHRIKQLCKARGWKKPVGLRYLPGRAIPLPDQEHVVRELIAKYDIGLIIVDSALSAVGGDLLDTQAAGRLVNFLSALGVECGVTSLVIAHTVKPKEDRLSKSETMYPFGSIFWHNLPRATHYIEADHPEGTSTSRITIWNRKGNRGRQAPMPLRIDFPDSDDGPISIVSDPNRKPVDVTAQAAGGHQKWIVARALEHGTGPMTVRELSEVTGIRAEKVRQLLNDYEGDLFRQHTDSRPPTWTRLADEEAPVWVS